jgi:hypothetical protein
MPNLYVLPVGPLPPNPAELLGSVRMKQVVETLAANFDHIIIDSPPVASFADSLILSSLVEGVIIVVKGGVTPREMAQRTKAPPAERRGKDPRRGDQPDQASATRLLLLLDLLQPLLLWRRQGREREHLSREASRTARHNCFANRE